MTDTHNDNTAIAQLERKLSELNMDRERVNKIWKELYKAMITGADGQATAFEAWLALLDIMDAVIDGLIGLGKADEALPLCDLVSLWQIAQENKLIHKATEPQMGYN